MTEEHAVPAPRSPSRHDRGTGDAPPVRPGEWWRLASDEHPLAEMPGHPEHGLILMVRTVRVVDDEIHSIVLYPHPIWASRSPRCGLKFLISDFLDSFTPEPDGAALREIEIAEAMGRVQGITQAMTAPPDPHALLAEKQTERQSGDRQDNDRAEDAGGAPSTGGDGAADGAAGAAGSDSTVPKANDASASVPAALLPSGDVRRAQNEVETTIAALEAQKEWITQQTERLTREMSLVSAYQSEKVNATLASISEETSRATALLENVQTMRLFLGEESCLTPLLDGAGADPSEPLTFMQRLLYLDEEIIINDLVEGFSDDQMDPEDLSALFARDFSLVERMLPYPRSAVLVRVRREARRIPQDKMDLVDLFHFMERDEADKRIHILIRDGARLHMVTADKTTSGAERFFPSRAEIDAMFRTRSSFGGESREIVPDNIEYAEAREAHDRKALFYKRFLILLWGIFERTDAFGPFMEKGSNWLSATVHDDRFRFIHDEENALGDGWPEITEFVDHQNKSLRAGSRAVIQWADALEGDNAPALCSIERDRVTMKAGVSLAEDVSLVDVQAEKGKLHARAPALRHHYDRADKPFNAKVRIARPARLSMGHLDTAPLPSCVEGVLCLDGYTLEQIAHYLESRAARRHYLRYARMFNLAYKVLKEEETRIDELHATMSSRPGAPAVCLSVFRRAAQLWRAGHKWRLPESAAAQKTVAGIAGSLEAPGTLDWIKRQENVVTGGVMSDGRLFAICDTVRASIGATPLPHVEKRVARTPTSRKTDTTRITWPFSAAADHAVLYRDSAAETAFLDRCAPLVTPKAGPASLRPPKARRIWQAPRGLIEAHNTETLARATATRPDVALMRRLLDGGENDYLVELVTATMRAHRAPGGLVELPNMQLSLGIMTAPDPDGLPLSWVLNLSLDPLVMALRHGNDAVVREAMGTVYRHPDKIFERMSPARGGVDIHARSLTHTRDLAACWIDTPALTFEPAGDALTRCEQACWEDACIGLFMRPDTWTGSGAFRERSFSPECLDAGRAAMSVHAAPEAEDLMREVFAMRQAERG